MLREYTVFNVEQCEGLPERVLPLGRIKPRNADQRDATIDQFLACSGATIREGFGEAYYRPSDDYISMPRLEAFKSAAHFYGVTFHELGHWTGHKSRLDRDLRHRFGERAYAAEELVAELCAAFLCAEFSLDGDLRHAGYIASWIGLLKADSRAFFTACNKAQAASRRGLSAGTRATRWSVGSGSVMEGTMRPKTAASDRSAKFEPIYDVDPITGGTIEVFFADHVFDGMRGGWHWWKSGSPGGVPDWPPNGPFGTSYCAYRDAVRSPAS
jgi:hypothetical protein